MFPAILFIIASKWKQPECPPVNVWLNRMLYVYTMEYCSSMKRDGVQLYASTWMNLEKITLKSQSQRTTYCYDSTDIKCPE